MDWPSSLFAKGFNISLLLLGQPGCGFNPFYNSGKISPWEGLYIRFRPGFPNHSKGYHQNFPGKFVLVGIYHINRDPGPGSDLLFDPFQFPDVYPVYLFGSQGADLHECPGPGGQGNINRGILPGKQFRLCKKNWFS